MEVNAPNPCQHCGAALSPLSGGLCAVCLLRDAKSAGGETSRLHAGADHLRAEQWFGHFRILERIAHGGVGIVYKALQPGVNRPVALKLLLSGAHASDEFTRRFQREAETAASLKHPNIVVVYDVGEVDGQPYLAMELVNGATLADILRQGPLPSSKAVRYMEVIAQAIHHAHGHNVLHRDLKPSNVLIDEQDEPRITDFGLAKRMDADAQITLTGQMMGTLHYLAPEQAAGDETAMGPATDVYSLGAMLYEMLVGRPPLMGDSIQETLLLIRDREPAPLRVLNPTIARDLETICLKCLAKEPSQRYLTALDFAEDLERFRRHQPIDARPVGAIEKAWRWARRRPALSGSLTLAVLALIAASIVSSVMSIRINRARHDLASQAETNRRGLVRLHSETGDQLVADRDYFAALLSYVEALRRARDPEQEVLRLRVGNVLRDSPALVGMLFHEASVNSVRFDKDGTRSLTASSDRTARVWAVPSGNPLTPPLPHDGEVLDAVFSPNNEWIATASKDGFARTWNGTTGQPLIDPKPHQTGRRLRPYPPYLVVTPDSAELIVVDGKQVRLMNPTNGAVRLDLDHPAAVEHANISNDGRRIVTCARDDNVRIWDRFTGELMGNPILMATRPVAAWFSPDGGRISVSTGDAVARIWNIETREALSPPIEHRGMPSQCLFSADGTRILTASFDLTRVWNGTNGLPVSAPLPHNHLVYQARFSPDGQLVATASFDNKVKFWDATTGAPRLTTLPHAAYATWVEFAPGGRLIATASRDGAVRLWHLPENTGRTFVLGPRAGPFALSPDESRLAAVNNRGLIRIFDLKTGRAVGNDLKQDGDISAVHFDRSGNNLLTSNRSGTARLWDWANGTTRYVFRHAKEITWSEFDSSSERIVTSSVDGTARIWSAATGEALTPPLHHDLAILHVSFSPDGTRVVTGGADRTAQVWNAETGEPIGERMKTPGNVMVARFSPDGRRVLTVSHDLSSGPGSARIWDAQTGEPLTPPLAHQSGLVDAEFSPDGRVVATAGSDNLARVWNSDSGQLSARPLAHQHWVVGFDFSPRGTALATISYDFTARLWDFETGAPLSPPLIHTANLGQVEFSRDGRRLFVSCWDGYIREWDVSPADESLTELEDYARLLSANRFAKDTGMMPLSTAELRKLWERLRTSTWFQQR